MDEDFEVKRFETCGQDFIADLCGCVDVITPVINYLVDLQGVQVPVWKVAAWFQKENGDTKDLSTLSIDDPPTNYINLKFDIHDIKEFKFNGHELVDGWLVVERIMERSEIVTWKMRQLVNDLQRLDMDLASSLERRHAKCLSSLQHTLTCMEIDSLINLLIGKYLWLTILRM